MEDQVLEGFEIDCIIATRILSRMKEVDLNFSYFLS